MTKHKDVALRVAHHQPLPALHPTLCVLVLKVSGTTAQPAKPVTPAAL
ncbi:hypothetical protein Q0M94_21815 (plasmid) [Deinococcus radiomollis]